MTPELTFDPNGPALSILSATPSSVYDLMINWIHKHPEWAIRRVGCERSKTFSTPSFMNEVSAALQFPYYFGHNWSAFRECINDLSWLRGANFLIVFDSAQHLLPESDDDFRSLLRILADTHDEWRTITMDFVERHGSPVAFQSVLACDPDAVDALTERVKASGTRFHRL